MTAGNGSIVPELHSGQSRQRGSRAHWTSLSGPDAGVELAVHPQHAINNASPMQAAAGQYLREGATQQPFVIDVGRSRTVLGLSFITDYE